MNESFVRDFEKKYTRPMQKDPPLQKSATQVSSHRIFGKVYQLTFSLCYYFFF